MFCFVLFFFFICLSLVCLFSIFFLLFFNGAHTDVHAIIASHCWSVQFPILSFMTFQFDETSVALSLFLRQFFFIFFSIHFISFLSFNRFLFFYIYFFIRWICASELQTLVCLNLYEYNVIKTCCNKAIII